MTSPGSCVVAQALKFTTYFHDTMFTCIRVQSTLLRRPQHILCPLRSSTIRQNHNSHTPDSYSKEVDIHRSMKKSIKLIQIQMFRNHTRHHLQENGVVKPTATTAQTPTPKHLKLIIHPRLIKKSIELIQNQISFRNHTSHLQENGVVQV